MSKFGDYALSVGIGLTIFLVAKFFIGELSSETDHIVVNTAIVLWFAVGYYLNDRLKAVHEKLDKILEWQAKNEK